MSRKSLLCAAILCGALSLQAQTKCTERLQRTLPGEGSVVLHQSQALADLVNGISATATPAASPKTPATATAAGEHPQDVVPYDPTEAPVTNTVKVRMNGYRIQVYSGGNSRQSKNEAAMMGQRVRSLFGDLSVYTHFSNPHWICRVGDFKTYEEANEMYRQMKETGRFREAVIVKSKIYATY